MRNRFPVGMLLPACALFVVSACGGRTSNGSGGSSGSASEAGSSGGSGGNTSEAGSGGGSGGSTSGDCNSMESAFCDKLAQCSPFELQSSFGNLQTCITRMVKTCTLGTAAPGVQDTPAQVGECAAALSQLDCTEFVHGTTVPDACDSVGALVVGKPCVRDAQCHSGYCSVTWSPPSAPCGVCAERAAAGEACSTSRGCWTGLVCNSNGVCAGPVQAGNACSGANDCASGLVCASGTCSPALAVGKLCSAGECDAWAGAYCDPSTHVCETYQLADAGQPCGAGVLCRNSGHCAIPDNQTQGICQAPAPDGAACDLVAGPSCQAQAFCVNGQCTFLDPAMCK
jgi:hypothetical protein